MKPASTIHRGRARRRFLSAVKYSVLTLVALANLFPFWWTILSSVKDNNEILVNTLSLPRREIKWSNYVAAWEQGHLSTAFFNTLIVAGIAVCLILLVSAMSAHIVARVKPSMLLYSFFSLGIMIPVQALIVPLFVEMKLFHMTNSRLGLILVYVAINFSLCFFILYGFLKTIPNELEEAATIDGASPSRTFFWIILPIAQPGLATVGIFALLSCWNEYLIPLVLTTDSAMNVIAQGVQNLKAQYITDNGLLCAGIVIAAIPVVIIYVIFQEQVIKGMTAGAVKG
jgi:raffinose/stachyose/melibiose transport system permease protein